MILYGIGDAFRSGTNKGMIMDYLKTNDWSEQKVNYYGHTRSWSQLGSALSALLAGFIVYYGSNYRIVFLVALLPYLINLFNIWSYPDVLNFPAKRKERQNYLATIKMAIVHLKNPNVRGIMNSAASHSAFMSAIKDYIQLVMVMVASVLPFSFFQSEAKSEAIIIGLFYFLIFLMSSFASRRAVHLLQFQIQNLSIKTLYLGLVFGALSGFFYFNTQWLVALICFVMIYLIENIRKPILTGEITDSVGEEVLTSILSVQSFLKSVLTIFFALTLGILVDCFGIGIGLALVSLSIMLLNIFVHLSQRKV